MRRGLVRLGLGAALLLVGGCEVVEDSDVVADGDTAAGSDVAADGSGADGSADSGGADADVVADVSRDGGPGPDVVADVSRDGGPGPDVTPDVAADVGPDTPPDTSPDAVEDADAAPPDCSHLDGPCTTGTFDADAGVCVTVDKDGLACDDSSLCTTGDVCAGGLCTGVAVDCDDGRVCTQDTCAPATGACAHVPATGPCDDGDACTTADTCQGASCVGSPLSGCDYSTAPKVSACLPGETSAARRMEALDRVNLIRGLAGLPAVAYASDSDEAAQAAALMIVANSDLDHAPPMSWKCYSEAGFEGSDTSNLHISLGSSLFDPKPATTIVDGFLIDQKVESLGHRRWILDPFLPAIAYGSVHGKSLVPASFPYAQGAALVVVPGGSVDISSLELPFVAYPVGDWPAQLFDPTWYLSFSVLADAQSKFPNAQVDLSTATVTVTGPGGALAVSSQSASNAYFGLPNHLQWKVAGLVKGAAYTVDIEGVVVGGQTKAFTYAFSYK